MDPISRIPICLHILVHHSRYFFVQIENGTATFEKTEGTADNEQGKYMSIEEEKEQQPGEQTEEVKKRQSKEQKYETGNYLQVVNLS